MAKITLSNYTVGKIVKAASAKVSAEKTTPPPYFTEATILDEMVAAHKYAATPAEQEMLKQTKGIGTARTRGEVLKELINGKTVERFKIGRKVYLRDTQAGRYLSQLAPQALKSVALTAKWEVLFSEIEKGNVTREQFKQISNQFVGMLVQDAKDKKAKMAR